MKKMLLKDWYIRPVNGGMVVVGYIFNDEKGRFEDGTLIHTSLVVYADFEYRVIKTLNSTYHLGLPK